MAFPNIQTAAAHLAQNDSAAAIPLLEELVEYFPGYATAHLLLVRAYRMDGQSEAALRALAQVRVWASNPRVVRRELRAIIDMQLDVSRSEDVTTSDRAEYPLDAPAAEETSSVAGSPPRSPRPQELEEDLRARLGPPSDAAGEDIKDLNSLIRKLEGARIQPEPDFSPEDAEEDLNEEAPEDELVSETLARIYVSQKEYRAAIETYQQLAEQHPDRSAEFLQKAREMEDKLE